MRTKNKKRTEQEKNKEQRAGPTCLSQASTCLLHRRCMAWWYSASLIGHPFVFLFWCKVFCSARILCSFEFYFFNNKNAHRNVFLIAPKRKRYYFEISGILLCVLRCSCRTHIVVFGARFDAFTYYNWLIFQQIFFIFCRTHTLLNLITLRWRMLIFI